MHSQWFSYSNYSCFCNDVDFSLACIPTPTPYLLPGIFSPQIYVADNQSVGVTPTTEFPMCSIPIGQVI